MAASSTFSRQLKNEDFINSLCKELQRSWAKLVFQYYCSNFKETTTLFLCWNECIPFARKALDAKVDNGEDDYSQNNCSKELHGNCLKSRNTCNFQTYIRSALAFKTAKVDSYWNRRCRLGSPSCMQQAILHTSTMYLILFFWNIFEIRAIVRKRLHSCNHN